MKAICYINLTNGLEGFAKRWVQPEHVRYMRLQSTRCEQKDWYRLIDELSDDLLFNLAVGRKCVIIDFGARKDVPRAIWQGMEFVLYCCHWMWYNREYQFVYERSKKCLPYFRQVLHEMPDRTRKKLRYYKQYCTGKILVEYRTAATEHDGNAEFYWSLIETAMEINRHA